ncbi:MAG TPA: glycosyltransferase family 4 protein [Candidatus Acidoferrales bacterium]|nr:glycosyltransferase family 4 protein [Candidatus Acidoferrales bacterium]
MNIWIFNHYADTPDRPSTRTFDLSKQLVQRGHSVTIFAAGFSHYSLKEERIRPGKTWHEEDWNGVRFIWLKTFPYRENGWRRMLNIVTFAWRAFWRARKLRETPDAIIGTTVHPLAALCAYTLSVVKKSRFFFEVTDLWPETLIDMGALSSGSPTAAAMRVLEKFLYRRAEKTIMLWPFAYEYTVSLGIPRDKIVWIPHGVDLSRLEKLEPYDGGISSPFTVMFLGGQSKYHGADVILDAAKLLQEENEGRVRFVIVGDGAEKSRLVQRAREMNLQAVEFRPLVPKSDIAKVMGEADAFIFHIRELALLRKYGISANKLYDYMSSGRPVIYAVNSRNNPIEEARAGVSIPSENPRALADSVLRVLSLTPAARIQMGQNGLKYLLKHHDIRILAEQLEQVLLGSSLKGASHGDTQRGPRIETSAIHDEARI